MKNEFTRAPHLLAGTQNGEHNAALLIDFDNVTMGIRSNLGQELRKLLDSEIIRGKVAVQRAYADWRRYPQYVVSLSEASIDLIFAPAYGSSRKNATDIRLAIDALELVFTRPEIGTFILLSGDSDFSSLVIKLKEYGKYIIGVGLQQSSSDLLVQNCDEYYSYNTLSGLTSAADVTIESHDPWELCRHAVERMVERGDVMRSDRLKQVMLELDPSFDEKSIGFRMFNRFLVEASARGKVRLEKLGNGQYEVGVSDAPPSSAEVNKEIAAAAAEVLDRSQSRESGRRKPAERSRRKPSDRGRRGRSRGRSETRAEQPVSPPTVDEDRLRAAYDLLRDTVTDLARGGEAVRDSEVKRKMQTSDESFDEAALGFRKFSFFLRQAHDEGIVNVEKTDGGNFFIAVVEAQKAPAAERTRPDRHPRRGASRSRTVDAAPTTGREATVESPASRVEATPDEAEEPVDATPVEAESTEAQPSEAQPAETESAVPPEKPAPRRGGLGRFRRGSRGGAPAKSPASATPKKQAKTESTRDAGAEGKRDARPEGKKEARSGSKSGAQSEAKKDTQSAGRKDTKASDSIGTAAGSNGSPLVDHMVREYQGVGRKTAERIVAEFGDATLEVIDRSPEKLSAVVPEARARAVIAARQEERESGSGQDA